MASTSDEKAIDSSGNLFYCNVYFYYLNVNNS